MNKRDNQRGRAVPVQIPGARWGPVAPCASCAFNKPRAAGYGVNVWTVNRPDRADRLFTWGCTGVFTDAYPLLDARPAR